VVLSHLGGEILLSLEQGSHVALKLNQLASDSFGGTRTDEASTERAGQNCGTENGDIPETHKNPPKGLQRAPKTTAGQGSELPL
jgi:hypothetical protein